MGWVVALLMLTILVVAPFNPRYLFLIVPLVFVSFVRTLATVVPWRWMLTACFTVTIVFNLFNRSAAYYPSLDPIFEKYTRAYYLHERSHEIVELHEENLSICDRIKTDFGSELLFVGPPFSYYFSLPQLGVVDAPLEGYSSGLWSDFVDSFRNSTLEDIRAKHPERSVVSLQQNPPADAQILMTLEKNKGMCLFRIPPATGMAKQTHWPSPLGAELKRSGGDTGWTMKSEGVVKASAAREGDTYCVSIESPIAPTSNVLLQHPIERLTPFAAYEIRLHLRSEEPRMMSFRIQSQDPAQLHFERSAVVGRKETVLTFDFVADEGDQSEQFEIHIEATPGRVQVMDFSICRIEYAK